MQIHVFRHGQQAGPYTPAQIQFELAAGSLHANDLAWYEGAANWLPLALVPGLYPAGAHPAPAFYPSAAPRTSGLAVASLVLGLLCLPVAGLTCLPAVICGHLSLARINRSMGRLTGRGIAVAGMTFGYVFLAFFALVFLTLFTGMKLPISSKVGVQSQETKSLAMARQLGLTCKLYAADNEGHFPRILDDLLPTYLTDRKLFVCPIDPSQSPMGYEYFGGTENDDQHRVLLQSKARSRDGRRVVVYVDGSGELTRR